MIDSRFVRFLTCVALLGLSIVQCMRSAHAGSDVVGLWSSISKSKGGLGTQLNLFPDGSLTQTVGAIVDFKYEIREGHIAMTFSPGDQAGKQAMTQTFQLRENTLVLDPGKRSEQVLQRSKESPDSTGLLGEWNYEHYTGGPALLRYASGHIGQLIVPMATLLGRYDMEGRRMSVRLEGQTAIPYDVQVDDDVLTLRDESGKETSFRRFHYSLQPPIPGAVLRQRDGEALQLLPRLRFGDR